MCKRSDRTGPRAWTSEKSLALARFRAPPPITSNCFVVLPMLSFDRVNGKPNNAGMPSRHLVRIQMQANVRVLIRVTDCLMRMRCSTLASKPPPCSQKQVDERRVPLTVHQLAWITWLDRRSLSALSWTHPAPQQMNIETYETSVQNCYGDIDHPTSIWNFSHFYIFGTAIPEEMLFRCRFYMS
jgi:hypothetical protein